MRIPKRYISLNSNPAWKIEGSKYESVDIKNMVDFEVFNNKICIGYLCENCSEVHYQDFYPQVVSSLMMHLLTSMLERRMNEWARYKEKMDKYQYKYSKKEIHSFQTMMLNEDYSEEED